MRRIDALDIALYFLREIANDPTRSRDERGDAQEAITIIERMCNELCNNTYQQQS